MSIRIIVNARLMGQKSFQSWVYPMIPELINSIQPHHEIITYKREVEDFMFYKACIYSTLTGIIVLNAPLFASCVGLCAIPDLYQDWNTISNLNFLSKKLSDRS